MNAHQQLIQQFYESFQRKDYSSMAACYAPGATFRDAVFDLKNEKEVAAMWHYLCETGADLSIDFNDIRADEKNGAAHWEARYTFSRTGRNVHNRIDAAFEFQDGKIIRHRDSFPFWRWSRMAFGPLGWLLGWTPILRNKVRRTAMSGLRRFMEKHPEYLP